MKTHKKFLLLSLLVLTACGEGGNSDSISSIPPENVTRAVAQLDEMAAEVFTRSGIPGMAISVVHQGKIVYAKGLGVRRLGESAAIDPDTVFQLASVSKPIGATVVAAQVGSGLVSWDTPVVQHLPWFSLRDPASTAQVTVGDLYSHRSGLPDHAGDELEEVGYGRRQVLERLHLLPSAPLRSRYAYTNFGLTAAAEAVAVASATDWESLSDQVLYRPLGMRATSSRYADFMARGNRARPHILVNGVFQPGPQRQPDAQSAAGGVSSSVRDMAAWMAMVLHEGKHEGRQIIPRDALLPALTPQVESSPPTESSPAGHYGYGFNISSSAVSGKQLSHSGAFILGAGTTFNLLPAADTGIVVLTNAAPVGAAEAVSMMYMDMVRFGHLTRDWFAFYQPRFATLTAPTGEFAGLSFPSNPTPALGANAYVGTYANSYYGEARVEQRDDGQLVLAIGPANRLFPLQHWDGNLFVFEPDGEIAPAGSRSAVSFSGGPGGIMDDMSIEVFNAQGLGGFSR